MHEIKRTIFIMTAGNILLIILRFYLAYISGSAALRANAWHSFSDILVSLTVLTFNYVIRRMGKDSSMAMKRTESIISIIISLLIFYMAYEIWLDALNSSPLTEHYTPYIALGSAGGVLINFWIAQTKIKAGRSLNSSSMIADGYHSRMDMLCSLAVVLGIIGALAGFPSLPRITAFIALFFLVRSGLGMLIENLNFFLRSLFS